MRKSQVWVSAILYMLIAATAMALIIQAGIPIINNMKHRSIYSSTEEMLVSLDKHIVDVANEGEGSQRVVPIDIKDGELTIRDGKLIWEYETETKIFEPKSRMNLGNLIITTNAGVTATENLDDYLLSNDKIRVNISKISDWSTINTSQLINYIEHIENSKKTNGTFSFTIGNDPTSKVGNGYTILKESGINLGFGVVVAHVNTTSFEYDLHLTLESEADFIRVNVKDLLVK